MKDSITAEGENCSNSGLSINPRGPALRNRMSHSGESKGALTPDANEANKSRYSRVVGCLNILSLLASFAREIYYTTDANSRHGRGFCQAAPVSLQNVFLFL